MKKILFILIILACCCGCRTTEGIKETGQLSRDIRSTVGVFRGL